MPTLSHLGCGNISFKLGIETAGCTFMQKNEAGKEFQVLVCPVTDPGDSPVLPPNLQGYFPAVRVMGSKS